MFAFRSLCIIYDRAGMMKEAGTSLRNRRTIPRPLISIVYARRLFKRELNIFEVAIRRVSSPSRERQRNVSVKLIVHIYFKSRASHE